MPSVLVSSALVGNWTPAIWVSPESRRIRATTGSDVPSYVAITIGAVVRLIDGPLAPIGCVSQTAYEKCTCPDEAHCGLRMLMLDVRNAIANILDRYTLIQVVEVTMRKMRRDGVIPPFAMPEQAASGKTDKGRVNPADGFLAGITQFTPSI